TVVAADDDDLGVARLCEGLRRLDALVLEELRRERRGDEALVLRLPLGLDPLPLGLAALPLDGELDLLDALLLLELELDGLPDLVRQRDVADEDGLDLDVLPLDGLRHALLDLPLELRPPRRVELLGREPTDDLARGRAHLRLDEP